MKALCRPKSEPSAPFENKSVNTNQIQSNWCWTCFPQDTQEVNRSPTHSQDLCRSIRFLSPVYNPQEWPWKAAITAVHPTDQFLKRDAHTRSALYHCNQRLRCIRTKASQQPLFLQRVQTRELHFTCKWATALVHSSFMMDNSTGTSVYTLVCY